MRVITKIICLSLFPWASVFAQTEQQDKSDITNGINNKVLNNNDNSMLLSRLGNTRIIFKDGSIRKNCKIKEIHEYWIVYEKEGSLHDQLTENIKRIEIGDKTMQAVFFDENNKPFIKTINLKF